MKRKAKNESRLIADALQCVFAVLFKNIQFLHIKQDMSREASGLFDS